MMDQITENDVREMVSTLEPPPSDGAVDATLRLLPLLQKLGRGEALSVVYTSLEEDSKMQAEVGVFSGTTGGGEN